MDRRVALQLSLQSSIKGLSVVGIVYYFVGLVGYAAKALSATEITMTAMEASNPVVAIPLTLGVGRIRKLAND